MNDDCICHSRRKYSMNTSGRIINTTYANAAYRLCIRFWMQTHRFGARARSSLFWFCRSLRHRYFMKDPVLVRGRLFLRFNVSAFILGYRMRASARAREFLQRPGFIISRVAGIYLANGGYLVLGLWFVARMQLVRMRERRGYLFNNYEIF